MEKMKAWIFKEYTDENGKLRGDAELQEIDKPVCTDDGAVLKINVASICGGDTDSIKRGGKNHSIYPGREFGHEMSATVVEVGKNVTDFKPGDRVWPFPMFCTNPPGLKSATLGGFSEYILAETAKKDYSLFSLDGVSDIEGSLVEPFTVGWRAASKTQPGPGKNAVIFGAGGIGIAAAVCCAWKGCDKVAIVGRRPSKLKICESVGFKTFTTLDADWKDQVRAYFGEGRAYSGQAANINCCIEATANDDVYEDIIPLMNFGAKIAAVSSHENSVHYNGSFFAYAELEMYGSGGQRHGEVAEVLEMMRSKKFDLEKIVTWIGPQEELKEGIQKMLSGEAVKGCIDYTGKYIKK